MLAHVKSVNKVDLDKYSDITILSRTVYTFFLRKRNFRNGILTVRI